MPGDLGAQWLMGFAAAAGLVMLVYRPVIRPVWRTLMAIRAFLDDWNGVPADKAHPKPRPGALERLASIESELHPNGGSSMKDQVGRIEAKVDAAAELAASAKNEASELKARVIPWIEVREDQLEIYRASLVETGLLDPDIARRDPARRDRKADREDT